MKKIVIKLNVGDESKRRKVLAGVAKLEGIKEMSIDAEKGTLTITGGVDPICVMKKIKKLCLGATIDSVADPPKPEDEDKDKDKDKHCPYLLPPCGSPCGPIVPPYYVEYPSSSCVIL